MCAAFAPFDIDAGKQLGVAKCEIPAMMVRLINRRDSVSCMLDGGRVLGNPQRGAVALVGKLQ